MNHPIHKNHAFPQSITEQALTDRTAALNLIAMCDPVDVVNVVAGWLNECGEAIDYKPTQAALAFARSDLAAAFAAYLESTMEDAA